MNHHPVSGLGSRDDLFPKKPCPHTIAMIALEGNHLVLRLDGAVASKLFAPRLQHHTQIQVGIHAFDDGPTESGRPPAIEGGVIRPTN